MKIIRVSLVALAGLLLSGVSGDLAAQRVRVGGAATVRVGPVRAEVRFPTYRRTVEYRDRRDRRELPARPVRRNSNAAYWCYHGAGHPDYGWAWCVDAGYIAPISRADFVEEDYREFRFRRLDRYERSRTVSRGELRHLLRNRRFDELRDHIRESRLNGNLRGEWIYPQNGGRVLVVYARNLPVAEYHDLDFDERVEVTFWLWP